MGSSIKGERIWKIVKGNMNLFFCVKRTGRGMLTSWKLSVAKRDRRKWQLKIKVHQPQRGCPKI